MKNSLNNLNEIFSEFAILFLQQQKEVEVGKGRRVGGRDGGKGWGKDRHFFLSANFSECQEVAWLRKKSLCYFHSFRNNLIRDLRVLKLPRTLNVRGHPCI